MDPSARPAEPKSCFLCCDADCNVRDVCCDCSFGVHPRCLARLLMAPRFWTCTSQRGLRAAAALVFKEVRPGARAAARHAQWRAQRGARQRLACCIHGAFEYMMWPEAGEEPPLCGKYEPRAAVAHCSVCLAPFRSVVGLYYLEQQLSAEGLLVAVTLAGSLGVTVAAILAVYAKLYALSCGCVAGLAVYLGAAFAAATLVHGERVQMASDLVEFEATVHFGVLDSGFSPCALRATRNMGTSRSWLPPDVELSKFVGAQ